MDAYLQRLRVQHLHRVACRALGRNCGAKTRAAREAFGRSRLGTESTGSAYGASALSAAALRGRKISGAGSLATPRLRRRGIGALLLKEFKHRPHLLVDLADLGVCGGEMDIGFLARRVQLVLDHARQSLLI